MPLQGEYEPSPEQWVRDQVEAYERSGGREASTLRETGMPVVIVTTRGNRSGKLRKTPLMRVEHEGRYALVASKGGAPAHPVWYHNLKADPKAVTVQDGPEPVDMEVHEASGEERAQWWERAVAAYPPYAEYAERTEREIPVFVAERRAAERRGAGMELTRRPLGRTGLSVTSVCVGTSALGGMPQLYGYPVEEERSYATLRAAFAGPLNFLDTSNGYAGGESERRIGAVLRELGGLPEGYVLATKVDPDGEREHLDFSGARARRSVVESQERLGLEHLQLVYLHDPERIAFEEAMSPGGPVRAMLELQAEGVIGHLGVAGGPVDLLRRFVATGQFEAVISHNRYTLLDRSALPLFEECAEAGVAVVNAAPFGGGMLAKGPRSQPKYGYRLAPDAVSERAGRMQSACERHEVPLAAAALQFSLRQPLVTSTVVGVTRPERIAETLDYVARTIPEELFEELEELVAPEELWLR